VAKVVKKKKKSNKNKKKKNADLTEVEDPLDWEH